MQLNITGMQGNRLTLKEAGIEFAVHNPNLKEIVVALDRIDAQLIAMPKHWTRKRASATAGRQLLLKIVQSQSGMTEESIRREATT